MDHSSFRTLNFLAASIRIMRRNSRRDSSDEALIRKLKDERHGGPDDGHPDRKQRMENQTDLNGCPDDGHLLRDEMRTKFVEMANKMEVMDMEYKRAAEIMVEMNEMLSSELNALKSADGAKYLQCDSFNAVMGKVGEKLIDLDDRINDIEKEVDGKIADQVEMAAKVEEMVCGNTEFDKFEEKWKAEKVLVEQRIRNMGEKIMSAQVSSAGKIEAKMFEKMMMIEDNLGQRLLLGLQDHEPYPQKRHKNQR